MTLCMFYSSLQSPRCPLVPCLSLSESRCRSKLVLGQQCGLWLFPPGATITTNNDTCSRMPHCSMLVAFLAHTSNTYIVKHNPNLSADTAPPLFSLESGQGIEYYNSSSLEQRRNAHGLGTRRRGACKAALSVWANLTTHETMIPPAYY